MADKLADSAVARAYDRAMEPSRDIRRLIEIMAALRDPETGCPWDVKQTFETIKPYTLEEAYEVADAIERNDLADLCDELGDLLLQVAFHARMAEEMAAFDFGDVVEAITSKMIRRHPHVFGATRTASAAEVKLRWNEIKEQEKAERAERRRGQGLPAATAVNGLLDDVPRSQPALSEALDLQRKAAKVGFDWSEADPIFNKIEEEIAELREALGQHDQAAVQEELGDLIFALVNLARHVGSDAEMALRDTNTKFRRRFSHIEAGLAAQGKTTAEADLALMEMLWQEAKKTEGKEN